MKIHWTIKAAAFVASVLTLSWFFAGWRGIHEEPGIQSWGSLIGGTLSTLLLLAVQGYWIYFDEKKKGSLRKTIKVFEKIHALIESSRHVDSQTKGSCCAKEAEST